jgi:cysteinyl-tRNA synthetase
MGAQGMSFIAGRLGRLVPGLLLLSMGSSSACNDSVDYRGHMRRFVVSISWYAKSRRPGFIVVPQNGHALMRAGEGGSPYIEYLEALDGAGQEDFLYGYRSDGRPTPKRETEHLRIFLDTGARHGLTILVTDYCSSKRKVDDSLLRNRALGFLSFAAPDRELDVIPSYPDPIQGKNDRDVENLSDAQNFLYLINPHRWDSKTRFVGEMARTHYDLLIIDAFFEDAEGGTVMLGREDIAALRVKPGGARRLVIAYMSIGEAEDYRYYWREEWKDDPPSWLGGQNSRWRGNYLVRYWDASWQRIIMGAADSYLDRIIDAGFDGVYLDVVAAYESFEG